MEQAFALYFDGPVNDDDWELLWTHKPGNQTLLQKLPIRAGRLANHCQYFRAAGQKCYYHGHIKRVHAALEHNRSRSARFPVLRSFVLNHGDQLKAWQGEVQRDPTQAWVLKRCNAGLSEGIELLSGEELVAAAKRSKPKDWTVAQEYMDRPWMGFGGRKFHLRVYVLVTDWYPEPKAFVYDEGVVFRSKHPYRRDEPSQARDIFSRISSDVEGVPHAVLWRAIDDASSSMSSHSVPQPDSSAVRSHMLDVIREIFSQALHASFGDSARLTQRGFGCFDLFGLDVMIGEGLEPFVLEVNAGPNIAVDDRGEESSHLLQALKGPLLQQLAKWAAMRVAKNRATEAASSSDDDDRGEWEAKEQDALRNWTRIL